MQHIWTEIDSNFFLWNLNQYISIDPGKLHPFLPCGVVYMKTHSHNNKKRKEWEGKERKDNYWLTEALDEIKYERKIIQSCCIHKDYDGHSSNIQIERDYSCDVLFCVYRQQQNTAVENRALHQLITIKKPPVIGGWNKSQD